MDFGEWLAPRGVAHRFTAVDKRQALLGVSETAARCFGLPCTEILDALLAREQAGSTGVGFGVAVPHAQLPGLDRLRAVFVRLDHAVPFDAVDGRPVDLMLALFAPPGAGNAHLRALARASRMLRQADLREQLRLARSADALEVLLRHEAQADAA